MSDIHKQAADVLKCTQIYNDETHSNMLYIFSVDAVMNVLFFVSHLSVKMGPWQPFHPKIAKLSS